MFISSTTTKYRYEAVDPHNFIKTLPLVVKIKFINKNRIVRSLVFVKYV